MKPLLVILSAFAVFLVATASAVAQTPKADVTTFQLGNQVVRIPAPNGFEEAASQFELLKNHFTVTEDPGNDMLAVHLPHADCEKLRDREFGPFNFYTKVSVRKGVPEEDYSAERFATLVSTFRKSGSQILAAN